jgi:hypothetical protein
VLPGRFGDGWRDDGRNDVAIGGKVLRFKVGGERVEESREPRRGLGLVYSS